MKPTRKQLKQLQELWLAETAANKRWYASFLQMEKLKKDSEKLYEFYLQSLYAHSASATILGVKRTFNEDQSYLRKKKS